MARYIDADKLEKAVSKPSIYDINRDDVIALIVEQPTADVVEVKHGEWLPDYETFVDEWERESEPLQTGWVCSLCGRQEFQREPYCHCGARMDGERKEKKDFKE